MPPATALPRVRDAARSARPYAIVFAISSVIVSRWFVSGTFVSTGDMGAFIRRGWEPGMAWAWNHQISGAGSGAHTIGRAFEFGLITLVGFLGGDETVAQWVFYTVIYGAVGVGVAFAARAVVRSDLAVVVAGTFGVMNGFFLTRLPNPLNIISVATVAVVTGIALRVAQGRRIPAVVGGIALMPTSFLAFNPPMLVVAFAWAGVGTLTLALLVVGRRGMLRLLKWLALAAPWAVLLNLYWMIPFAGVYTGGGGPESNATFTDPTNWSWATVNNTIPNILTMVANWAWYRPQYLPFASALDQPSWVWVRYLLPTLLLLAPVLAVRAHRRAVLSLWGMSAVFVFLAKGINAPFAGVNLWLYLHAPGFWLFREPMSKLGQLLVVFFGMLLAIAVHGGAVRFRGAMDRRAARRVLTTGGPPWPGAPVVVAAVGVVALAGTLAYPYPLVSGSVIPDERPMQPSAHVRVPEYWRAMAETIDADHRDGKVLVLPLDDYYQMPTTWGFFGVDSIANLLIRHPVVQPKPDGYFGDVAGFKANVVAVEAALLAGDLEPVPRLLDAIGVSEVIVRHDLVRGLPGRTFADDAVLAEAIARVPGLTRVVDGPLELWQVGNGSSDSVRVYDRTLGVASDPAAASAVIGTVGTSTAVAPRQDSTPPPTSPTVDKSPQVTDDAVVWPVPAVDSGAPDHTVELAGGEYLVGQRARAAAVLTPRVGRRSVRFVDPTRVRIDGRVVSRRPDLEVAVPDGSDVAAVAVGPRTVSLDGWGRDGLPRPRGSEATDPTVTVGAATPLTVLAQRTEPVEATPMSDVYDCNNYEPRPARQLGLRKQLIDARGGRIVRLSAEDHAACTRIEITEAAPGDVYRIRLEYRQVEGKRPQICIWQMGTDGCDLAPRAQLTGEWIPYERFVTVDEVADGVQLVLHADVGERLLGRTVTDYRNVRIDAMTPVRTATLWPPAVPQTRVTLPAGTHVLEVTGGPAGSVMSAFEPLQDCFRHTDQTMSEAGLGAEITGDPDNPQIVLSARDHMACLGATIPDMGGSSLYELSLEATSVSLRDPKFCLYLRGPDTCSKIPAGGPWKGWTRYETLVAPDPRAVETRMYLYGRRDLDTQQVAKVGYRDVKVRPVASPVSVVLVREPDTDRPVLDVDRTSSVTYDRLNPANFTLSGSGAGTGRDTGGVLALTETYAPGWRRVGADAAHASVQGWMNAWPLEEGATEGSTALTYAPARRARLALYLFPFAAALGAGSIAWSLRRSRRIAVAGRTPSAR
jgi:arabinofuranan 3-O-arabinosyltransferase